MKHNIRLGPIAIFMTIVVIVLATLSVLTTATTNADKVMAQRFADITKARYELEAKGEKFIQQYDEQAQSGKIDLKKLGVGQSDDEYVKNIKNKGYILEIRIRPQRSSVSPGSKNKRYEITLWKLSKEWNADDPYSNVWKGE